jgi:dienelactone hydrolase
MKARRILTGISAVWLTAAWPAAAQVEPDLLQHWSYDQKQPLDVQQLQVRERNGAKLVDLTYAAPVGDRGRAVGPNGGKVAAYLVLPPGKGPFPAVIYGHWCMPGSEKKNRTEFLEEAMVLAQSGVISLLPDHVSVRPEFVEDNTPLNENQVAVTVQQVINLRRGADLLLARSDVDAKRIAYVGHSCDATAGGFLSGVDKRIRAFVLMAGDLSDEVDKKSKSFEQYRQKVGAPRLDAFMQDHAWLDAGKYVSEAAPATLFLQYASDEPFLDEEMEQGYCKLASEPKKCKIYKAQHALSPEATRDRVAFLSDKLSFRAPAQSAVDKIPALVEPPWPKE